MPYSEMAYFEGNHCQHVAAYDEARRLARIAARNREALRMVERRKGSRARAYG